MLPRYVYDIKTFVCMHVYIYIKKKTVSAVCVLVCLCFGGDIMGTLFAVIFWCILLLFGEKT